MMSVTCGKFPSPCRGNEEAGNWKADLGRRYALPQATLHCPFVAECDTPKGSPPGCNSGLTCQSPSGKRRYNISKR
jgi:hypothetical protein